MSTDLDHGVAAVVVLAAGAGTRMKSNRSKLLHEIAGRSLLSYAVDAANAVEPERLVVVVGHQRNRLRQTPLVSRHATIAVQDPAGTGDAVRAGMTLLPTSPRGCGDHGDAMLEESSERLWRSTGNGWTP